MHQQVLEGMRGMEDTSVLRSKAERSSHLIRTQEPEMGIENINLLIPKQRE